MEIFELIFWHPLVIPSSARLSQGLFLFLHKNCWCLPCYQHNIYTTTNRLPDSPFNSLIENKMLFVVLKLYVPTFSGDNACFFMKIVVFTSLLLDGPVLVRHVNLFIFCDRTVKLIHVCQLYSIC